MTDYIGLIQGYRATTDARLGQVLSWLRDLWPETPNLDGRGNYVDAWRHGGTAALLAYHHGYDNVKRWGDALEDYRPDNEQEFRQDIRNNEVGAKIGALARLTGMTSTELGDAVKAAFQAGAFRTDAYAPLSGGQTFQVGNMKLSVGSGVITLPDGSPFDLTKSAIISDGDHEYPLLHVIRRDGSVQDNWTNMEDSRTLFQSGVGKWELPQSGEAPAASFNDRFSAPAFGTPNHSSVDLSSPDARMPVSRPNITVDPAGGPRGVPSPVIRAPQKGRRSAAPDGPASTSAQGTLPATPAFQPDIVGAGGVLGKFIGDTSIAPAAASPSWPLSQGSTSSNLPSEETALEQPENALGAPRFHNYRLSRVSSAFPGSAPPDPDQPAPFPEPALPLGIFSGKPMLPSPLPPSVFGLPDNSDAAGNGDIFSFLAGLASWKPTPTMLPQSADGRLPPYLDGRIAGQSKASIFDAGAAALPFGPSDDPNFDPMQPWTVQGRR